MYPKDPSQTDDKGDPLERGRDLFDAFRPCYIRAYTDAKDIMPDTGAVIDGTKSSTADDFLSFGEFRYFNIFICAYAAMYDAFAKIDGALGGGASEGRDGDALRMEKDEWLAGYKRVAGVCIRLYNQGAFLAVGKDELDKPQPQPQPQPQL